MTSLDPNRLDTIFRDCLFTEEEAGAGPLPEGEGVIAEGVVNTFGFHRERLESHRAEVREMLLDLDEAFLKSKGGGWSFLNACVDREGRQWTGLHLAQEQLMTLGIGLGLVQVPLPRELWSVLPGGVPYFVVLDE